MTQNFQIYKFQTTVLLYKNKKLNKRKLNRDRKHVLGKPKLTISEVICDYINKINLPFFVENVSFDFT